jgi:hypothetical protein
MKRTDAVRWCGWVVVGAVMALIYTGASDCQDSAGKKDVLQSRVSKENSVKGR